MTDFFDNIKTAAVIVAHPDDETLWCGGLILSHPEIEWLIFALCRKSDVDRAPKFLKVAEVYSAKSIMADLDDGAEQRPLEQADIQQTILNALPKKDFDLILTHSPKGEYTRHLRHEETARAVLTLWKKDKLRAGQLLIFAYEDGQGKYPPRPVKNADIVVKLAKSVFKMKKDIIISSYGFSPGSFEAKAVSDTEAFWLVRKT